MPSCRGIRLPQGKAPQKILARAHITQHFMRQLSRYGDGRATKPPIRILVWKARYGLGNTLQVHYTTVLFSSVFRRTVQYVQGILALHAASVLLTACSIPLRSCVQYCSSQYCSHGRTVLLHERDSIAPFLCAFCLLAYPGLPLGLCVRPALRAPACALRGVAPRSGEGTPKAHRGLAHTPSTSILHGGVL